jgi:prepilin-type N-terminal cleavage/methylation domain-containing protein
MQRRAALALRLLACRLMSLDGTPRRDVEAAPDVERVQRQRFVRGLASCQAGVSLVELLVAMALMTILTGMALATFRTEHVRLSSDADAIKSRFYVARLRAANQFTRARVTIDPAARMFTIERFDRANSTWEAEGPAHLLSPGVDFGFGPATNAPPALGTLDQTLQVVFNSRGVPVDAGGSPTGTHAVYVTNQQMTLAITVSVGGRIAIWRFAPAGWSER